MLWPHQTTLFTRSSFLSVLLVVGTYFGRFRRGLTFVVVVEAAVATVASVIVAGAAAIRVTALASVFAVIVVEAAAAAAESAASILRPSSGFGSIRLLRPPSFLKTHCVDVGGVFRVDEGRSEVVLL